MEGSLFPGSCRPWVALERAQIEVPPAARLRFRFETRVPVDATPRECRYALLIDGLAAAPEGARPFDVHGRLAVVVYVRVGDVRPALSATTTRAGSIGAEGATVDVLVHNTGEATGRLDGAVRLHLKSGEEVPLEVESVPVLPGMSRWVKLRPQTKIGSPVVQLPAADQWRHMAGELAVQGTLDRLVIAHSFADDAEPGDRLASSR